MDISERNFFINIITKVSKYLIYFESKSRICQSLSTLLVCINKQVVPHFPAHIVIRHISPNQSSQFLKMCTGMFLRLIRHFGCFTMHLLFKNCDDWLGLMYLITMCAEKYKEQLVCLYRLTAY